MSVQDPVSPCTSVCQLDTESGWCRGCHRTIAEIARWADMSPQEKQRVLGEVARRQASATRSASRTK